MKIIESSFDTIKEDLTKALTSGEETIFGYLVADQIAIWDPVWLNPNEEVLPPIRYNKEAANAFGFKILEMPLAGGSIVNNYGDIGILVISRDMHSKWEIAAMQDIVDYLKKRYRLTAEIQGNDILLDGKKFIGTSIGFSTNYRYAAMFISMNNYTTPLIKAICLKESKHNGFVGLNKYKVCPRKLITRMLRFTKKWEARGL